MKATLIAAAVFFAPMSAPAAPPPADLIAHPVWVTDSIPPLMRFYPPDAKERGIEGRSVVECMVTTDGALKGCTAVGERPEGLGFGQAGLRLAAYARVKPADEDGQPTAGRHVRMMVTWKLSEK
ncbi:MAG: TonB family protein [Proteobacteria bacterium]|nr:TonB family protein [Pseudomonadota bacterium]